MSIQEDGTHTFPQQGGGGRSFRLRLSAVLVSYLVALGGALSLFSVPFYVTLLVMVGGLITPSVGSRALPKPAPPKMTWRDWTIYIAGCAVIIGVLSLFGD